MQAINACPEVLLGTRRLANGRLEVNAIRMHETESNWTTVESLVHEEFDLPTYLAELARLPSGIHSSVSRPKPSLQVLHAGLVLLSAIATDNNRGHVQDLVPFADACFTLCDEKLDLRTRALFIRLAVQLYISHGTSDHDQQSSSESYEWSYPRIPNISKEKAPLDLTALRSAIPKIMGGLCIMSQKIATAATVDPDTSTDNTITATSVLASQRKVIEDLFFFGTQVCVLVRLMIGTIPTADHTAIMDQLNSLVRDLTHLKHSAGKATDCCDYFVAITRAWRAILDVQTTNSVPQTITHRLQKPGLLTAGVLFRDFDGEPAKLEARFGDLPSIIDKDFHILMRVEACRLIHAIADHEGQLLRAIENSVWVGDNGGQAIGKCQTLVKRLSDIDDLALAREQQFMAGSNRNSSTPDEVFTRSERKLRALAETQNISTRLTATILGAIALIEDDSKTRTLNGLIHKEHIMYQHILRKTEFFSCILCGETGTARGQSQSLLKLLAFEKGQANWLCAEEKELVQSCFTFLQKFVAANGANQMSVVNTPGAVDLVFEKYFGTDLGEIEFLKSLFSHDNRAAARSVSQGQLKRICKSIRWSVSTNTITRIVSPCAVILHNLVGSEHRPIVENQHTVMEVLLVGGTGRGSALDTSFWLRHDKVYLRDSMSFVQIDSRFLAPLEVESSASRLNYHVSILHLLANCTHSNDLLGAKLRELMPLPLFVGCHKCHRDPCTWKFEDIPPGILCRGGDTPPVLLHAYMHVFETIYVEPLAKGYHFIEKLFFQSVTGRPQFGPTVSEAAIDMLADGLSAWLVLFADIAVDSVLLYPEVNHSGGGLLSLLTTVFETNLVENADDADSSVKCTSNAHWSFHETSQLANIIVSFEQKIAAKLGQLVDHVAAGTDDHQRQLLSRFAASLNLSAAFDIEKRILSDEPKSELKAKIDAMRSKMSTFGLPEHEHVDTFEKFQRVSKAALSGDPLDRFTWSKRLYPQDFDPSVPGSSYWWAKERDCARDSYQFARWVQSVVMSVHGGCVRNSGATTTAKYNIEHVKLLVDMCEDYPDEVNVNDIIMGFNGALLREAWAHMGAQHRANPIEDFFIAPAEMKMAIAGGANGFRLLSSVLKRGHPDEVSRVARLALLLLQGKQADISEFSSQGCQFACLDMEKKLSASRRSMLPSILNLLELCMTSVEGNLTSKYQTGARLFRMLQLLCENQCSEWQDQLGTSKLGHNAVSRITGLFHPFARSVRERTPTPAAMRAMEDDDPRLAAAAANVALLSQFVDCMGELIVGPHRHNQRTMLTMTTDDGVNSFEYCTAVLYWLVRRQIDMRAGSSQGMSYQRKVVRKRRLAALMAAETSIASLMNMALEGYDPENFQGLIRILRRPPEGTPLSTGLDCLMDNLVAHEKFTHSQQFEDAEEANANLSKQYFILIGKLQNFDGTVHLHFRNSQNEEAVAAWSRMSKIIRTIQVAVQPHGESQLYHTEPAIRYQMLYFDVPSSCAKQEHSPLLSSFFHGMYDADVYLDHPWSQRHRQILSSMHHYIAVHDYQAKFDANLLLKGFQRVGGKLYLLTILQTLVICVVLLVPKNSALHDVAVPWGESAGGDGGDGGDADDTDGGDADAFLSVNASAHVISSTLKFVYYFSQMPLILAQRAYRERLDSGEHLGMRAMYTVKTLFGGTESIFMICCVVCSWLGNFVDPFFFFFHLLEFFFIAKIARVLLDVVISRFRQLLVTLAMGFLLIVIFSAIGWKLIIPHFKYEIAGHPKWTEGVEFHEFVLAHVLHGIEEGPQSKLGDGTQEPGYMTLTVVYFVVIIVIQTAVIQGIVIDVSARDTPHRGTHDLPACSSVYTAKTL
jgi:hypothetical protein